MIKKLITKYKLKLATLLLDSVFNAIDSNDDGAITKEELLSTAQTLDNSIQVVVDLLRR